MHQALHCYQLYSVSCAVWVRTKHGPGVHGPPLWTGSMDSFFYFYKNVLHQVNGHSKTEIVPKKDLTRRCRPMLTIDHKYLVVLT